MSRDALLRLLTEINSHLPQPPAEGKSLGLSDSGVKAILKAALHFFQLWGARRQQARDLPTGPRGAPERIKKELGLDALRSITRALSVVLLEEQDVEQLYVSSLMRCAVGVAGWEPKFTSHGWEERTISAEGVSCNLLELTLPGFGAVAADLLAAAAGGCLRLQERVVQGLAGAVERVLPAPQHTTRSEAALSCWVSLQDSARAMGNLLCWAPRQAGGKAADAVAKGTRFLLCALQQAASLDMVRNLKLSESAQHFPLVEGWLDLANGSAVIIHHANPAALPTLFKGAAAWLGAVRLTLPRRPEDMVVSEYVLPKRLWLLQKACAIGATAQPPPPLASGKACLAGWTKLKREKTLGTMPAQDELAVQSLMARLRAVKRAQGAQTAERATGVSPEVPAGPTQAAAAGLAPKAAAGPAPEAAADPVPEASAGSAQGMAAGLAEEATAVPSQEAAADGTAAEASERAAAARAGDSGEEQSAKSVSARRAERRQRHVRKAG